MTFPRSLCWPVLTGMLVLSAATTALAQTTTAAAPGQPPGAGAATAATPAPRRIAVADVDRIATVRDPQRSPEGQWVAYIVETVDVAKDKSGSDVYMVRWDGSEQVRLTASTEIESSPRWSPDGKWLSFVRPDEKKKPQVWTLSRRGGEAQKLTEVPGGVTDYAWSPDSTRLVIVSRDADPDADDDADDDKRDKVRRPIEIETFKFKRDQVGYVDGRLRTHLYLYDLGTRTSSALTSGPWDDSDPVWSPDGKRLAFLSARSESRERSTLREVYVVDATAGSTPRPVSAKVARHSAPLVFSPDGTRLLYMEGGDPRYDAYEQFRMAVVPVSGGSSTLLTPTLDRPVSDVAWSKDGGRVTFVVSDDREQYVASVAPTGGAITRLTRARRSCDRWPTARPTATSPSS